MFKVLLLLSFLLHFTGIYDYTIKDIYNHDINFSSFKGKKILIVNTASESEFASQYKSLDSLSVLYKGSLVIIACPSNSFGNENKSESEIEALLNAGEPVHFIVSGKINVSGQSIEPLFKWLTQANLNGALNCNVKGDFYKFLVDSSGNFAGVFAPSVNPMSDELKSAIIN